MSDAAMDALANIISAYIEETGKLTPAECASVARAMSTFTASMIGEEQKRVKP